MWIAVMIFVFLGVEILNYINGENNTAEGFEDDLPEFDAQALYVLCGSVKSLLWKR